MNTSLEKHDDQDCKVEGVSEVIPDKIPQVDQEVQMGKVEPRKPIDEKKVEVVSDDIVEVVKEEEVIELKPITDVVELESIPQKEEVVEDDVMIEQPSIEHALVVKDENEKEAISDVNVCLQVKKDPWQRENLFHARCLIQGKTCKLTVDSGSCGNVVS